MGVPLSRCWSLGPRAGALDLDVTEVAVTVGVPVVPVAVAPRIGPAWRVVVGGPIATRRRGTARLAEDIALLAREQVAELLGTARL